MLQALRENAPERAFRGGDHRRERETLRRTVLALLKSNQLTGSASPVPPGAGKG